MKIVVVDDDRLVCSSLKIILEADDSVEVVAIGYDGSDAIELYDRYRPDLLLMDIRMTEINGLCAAQEILKTYSDARILFLTTFSDDEYILKALEIGAKGYILKQNFESILPAVKAVYIGQNVFGDEVVTRLPKLIENYKATNFLSFGITDKEFEIIERIAQGMSNKEISEALHFSEGTIRNYLSIILEKLNLRDRTQLAIFYYKNR